MPYLTLALAFCFNAAANVLLKVAALRGFSFAGFFRGDWTAAHGIALLAAVLFGANLVCYLAALEYLPLSVAYPVMIGMTFFITTAATLLLGEHLSLTLVTGMVLILGGIGLVLATAL